MSLAALPVDSEHSHGNMLIKGLVKKKKNITKQIGVISCLTHELKHVHDFLKIILHQVTFCFPLVA